MEMLAEDTLGRRGFDPASAFSFAQDSFSLTVRVPENENGSVETKGRH
jgi:hypothetical protein